MIRDDLQVFNIEVLSMISVGFVVSIAVVPGAAGDRIRLARWSANKHPSVGPVESIPDPAVEDAARSQPECCLPRLAPCRLRFCRIRLEQRCDGELSTKHVVILRGNCA